MSDKKTHLEKRQEGKKIQKQGKKKKLSSALRENLLRRKSMDSKSK